MSLNKVFKAKDQLQALAKINNPRLEEVLKYLHNISTSSIESYQTSTGVLRGFKFIIPNNPGTFFLSDDGKHFTLSIRSAPNNVVKRKDHYHIENIDELQQIINGYRTSVQESIRAKFVFEALEDVFKPVNIENFSGSELFKAGSARYIKINVNRFSLIQKSLKKEYKPTQNEIFKLLNIIHYKPRFSIVEENRYYKILGFKNKYDLPINIAFKIAIANEINRFTYDIDLLIYALENGYKPTQGEKTRIYTDMKSDPSIKKISKFFGKSIKDKSYAENIKDFKKAEKLLIQTGFVIDIKPTQRKRLNLAFYHPEESKYNFKRLAPRISFYKKYRESRKFDTIYTIRNTGNIARQRRGGGSGRLREDPTKTYVEHAQYVIDLVNKKLNRNK